MSGKHRIPDMGVGFLGGVMGGAASLSGVVPTMWCALQPWPKSETRAVLQPFNLVILGATAVLLVKQGAFGGSVLVFALIALPANIVATRLGLQAYAYLGDDAFRRVLVALMLLTGLSLGAQSLTGA